MGHRATWHVTGRTTAAELRSWAGRRPWHGGLLVVAAGLAIMVLPARGFTVLLLPGIAGLSGFVIGGVLASLGLFMLFSPHLHGPLGVGTVVLSLASFVTTNLGGFVVGMLAGIVGGALAFAWVAPDPEHGGG